MNKILPAFRRRAGFLLSKLNKKSLYALYFILSLCLIKVNAQVSGRIYQDYNANGIWDSTATHLDQGKIGTLVQVFDKKGILKGSTTTNADGKYFIPNVSGDLRLQITLPAYYSDGFITSINKNSQSSIQFIKAPATDVDLGMNFGDDYCGDTPKMIVSCYAVGIGGQSEDAIVTIPYSASGKDASVKQMMSSPMQSMGCLWGGAYQKTSGSFFSGSFMKRHAAFGIGGPSAIYVTKNADKPNIAQSEVYIKLSDFGIDTGKDPHPRGSVNNDYDFQLDTGTVVHEGKRYNATELVGKMSLGDIDLTSDGEYMFVSNLWNCKIYRIHIGNPHKPGSAITAADIVEYDIPHPWDENPVTGVGIARTFGFCPRQGKMYVGIICDASISQNRDDLKARIYEMDYDNPANPNWKLLIEFSLNYIKGFATGELPNESNKWYPWFKEGQEWWSLGLPDFLKTKYVSYPMPMLSDIEIDSDGSLVVAFMDRFAHQTRLGGTDAHGNHHGTFGFDPRLGGDVLRIGNCNGVWTLENNGSVCGGTPTPGKDNNEGIGGGEFYHGDGNAPLGHNELSVGSLAFLPGSREMVLASTDPIGEYSAGMVWLSSNDGKKNRAYELLEGLSALIANAPVGYGKAASIGDINMICKLSPLEIGNRLWRDDNGNGIQEAGEPGIADVLLHLVNADNQIVGQDTTDINGVYSFNHFNVVDTVGVLKHKILGPQAKSKYFVKVKGKIESPVAPGDRERRAAMNNNVTNNHGLMIDDSILGNANAGSGPNQDLLDSDGVISGSDGVIEINTEAIGQSNHSFDFAYCPLPKLDLVAQKATCDPVTDQVQNNASITLSNLQFSQKVGYSLGTVYTGPLYDDAKEIGSRSVFKIDSLAGSNTDLVYTVRVFNASDDCSRDLQVTIEGTVCVPCAITGTANASSISVNHNGTPSNLLDDYFTVSVQANATNAGAAELYEVVIDANPDGTGGTVLNPGGTYYNQSIKVGLGKELKANGQAIKLTVRDAIKKACVNSVSVQADAFRYECKPEICMPLKTARADN